MRNLTADGQQKIREIAQRYGLSESAVLSMLQAVLNGGGTMAQFNISELGGGGQWMQGGMTMVGDMFNHGLKNTVNNLCAELSNLTRSFELFDAPVTHANGNGFSNGFGNYSSNNWWPSEFGNPSSSGGQNNMRYAYFPAPVRRLVIEENGQMKIYDTQDHHVSGVSQQQSGNGYTLQMSSQFGYVDLRNLPLVSPDNSNSNNVNSSNQQQPQESPAYVQPQQQQAEVKQPSPSFTQEPEKFEAPKNGSEIIATIEKLGELVSKGFISKEEFESKKAELLKRL